MPIYEYQCTKCGEVRESMKPMSESDSSIEEDCGIPKIPSGTKCLFIRILSPTPTDFRFNDFQGYGGLDKRRPS